MPSALLHQAQKVICLPSLSACCASLCTPLQGASLVPARRRDTTHGWRWVEGHRGEQRAVVVLGPRGALASTQWLGHTYNIAGLNGALGICVILLQEHRQVVDTLPHLQKAMGDMTFSFAGTLIWSGGHGPPGTFWALVTAPPTHQVIYHRIHVHNFFIKKIKKYCLAVHS